MLKAIDKNNCITQKIIKQAAKNHGPYNKVRLSHMIGMTEVGLYYNFIGRNTWHAESWLQILACLGALEIKDDKIIINTTIEPKLKKKLNTLKSMDYVGKSIV